MGKDPMIIELTGSVFNSSKGGIMKTFAIKVIEKNYGIIRVEGETLEDAKGKVVDAYNDGDGEWNTTELEIREDQT